MGRRSTLFADDIAEDFCFVCKDGGDFRVCDFKNCLKVYHPRCVGKEDDFLSSGDQFICDWHKCVNCKRNSDYQCLCCPSSSACGDCLGKVEFVQVKQNKGFCNNCLKMAIMIEKNEYADPKGERVDFRGTENYEILFRDYWAVIKGKECLTLLDLQAASILIKRILNYQDGRDSEKFLDEYHKADGNLLGDNDDAEQTFLLDTVVRPNEVQASRKRKRSNKKTYVDWGSKELIEFLSCIGKDTTKSLDHFRVTGVVKEYIQQNNLLQDKKKKSVLCDDNLRSLFSKRKLKYNTIHRLLEVHLAANAVSEDESLDGSEDDDGPIMKKKPQNSLETKIPKRVSEINKRRFASLNQNNLKLIYLRRTLVMQLLSHPDTFEQKVVGCFVRVKNDLKSYSYQMSKKRYQLGLVTGIKKSSEEYKIKDTCTDILLCVSNVWDDIKISMLSEEDFEEDECHDLRLLAKKELFKRPTVAELEEKEASLHADIVNHWIDKELLRLEKEFERAHEKGWRQEMNDLMCQKKLLSTLEERQRRLEEIPEVIPDPEEERKETEFGAAESNPFQGNRGNKRSIAACLKDAEDTSKVDTSKGARKPATDSFEVVIEESLEGATKQVAHPVEVTMEESPEGASERGDANCEVSEAGSKALGSGGTPGPGLHNQMHTSQDGGSTEAIDVDKGKEEYSPTHHKGGGIDVIDLVSDEDEDLHPEQHEPECPEATNTIAGHPYRAMEIVNGIKVPTVRASEAVSGITMPTCHSSEAITGVAAPALGITNGTTESTSLWYYMDPEGNQQGPFAMAEMRQWQRNGFFPVDFRVWRIGQTQRRAILLTDAMRMTF